MVISFGAVLIWNVFVLERKTAAFARCGIDGTRNLWVKVHIFMQNSLTLTLSSSILSYCKNNHKFAELCFLTVSGVETPISGRRGVSKPPCQPPPSLPPYVSFPSSSRRFYCPLRFGRPSSRSTALLRKLPLFSCMTDPKSGFFLVLCFLKST